MRGERFLAGSSVVGVSAGGSSGTETAMAVKNHWGLLAEREIILAVLGHAIYATEIMLNLSSSRLFFSFHDRQWIHHGAKNSAYIICSLMLVFMLHL